jgi:hypothetical protein
MSSFMIPWKIPWKWCCNYERRNFFFFRATTIWRLQPPMTQSENSFNKYPHGAQMNSFQTRRAQEHRTMWYGKYWSKFCLSIRLVPTATRNQALGLLSGCTSCMTRRTLCPSFRVFPSEKYWTVLYGISYLGVLHEKMSTEFKFDLYWFNIIPTLHETVQE